MSELLQSQVDYKPPVIKIILDTRREKETSENTKAVYPVKLYVYDPILKKANRYGLEKTQENGTTFEFTKDEFESIWETKKPRRQYLEFRAKLNGLLEKSISDAESIQPFTFYEFEKTLGRKSTDRNNVFWHFKQLMDSKKGIDSVSNLQLYKYSERSIKGFIYFLNKERKQDHLPFEHITVDWLKKYEAYMERNGKSKTTVAMYLKPLQAVFNSAGIKNDNPKYPFGVGKYRIKEARKSNKALSTDELKTLLNSNPISPDQQKAKDFFFFSFFCNGMNVKDILLLKYGQIRNDEFTFYRSKTKSTDSVHKEIKVCLNDFTKMVIKEYGISNIGMNPKQFVFPILNLNDAEEIIYHKIKRFTRYINQHLKKLAVSLGLSGDISTYFARHSFATGLIRKGLPLSFLKDSLGHSDEKTTQLYMAGFTDKTRKDAAEALYHDLID